MERRLYFLHRDEAKANHAGSKAVRDAEDIFLHMGMSPLPVYSGGNARGIFRKIRNGGQLLRLFTLPAGSVLFVQYPMYRMKRDYVKLLMRVKKIRRIRLVFLVHDLEIIRHAFPENPDLVIRDREMLKAADKIIVHNEKMADLLVTGYGADREKLIPLGIFDYLTPGVNTASDEAAGSGTSICVAGNLDPNKCGYINALIDCLPDDIDLNLYGVNYAGGEDISNVKYHGSFDADVLPEVLESSFGLVWDGPDADGCTGNMGGYMRYNNPHKVSLYIAAGIPVIIWEEAALADFVTSCGIGFTVSSLKEIPGKLSAVGGTEYRQYMENILPLRERVRDGFYLKSAVKTACLQKKAGV